LEEIVSQLGLADEVVADTIRILKNESVSINQIRSGTVSDEELAEIGIPQSVTAVLKQKISEIDEKKKRLSEATFTQVRFTVVSLRVNDRHAHEHGHCVQISNFLMYYDGNVIEGGKAENPGGNNPPGEGPSNISGTLPGTGRKWLDFNVKALIIKFPKPVTADSYTIVTANDYPIRDPVAWTLESSENGSEWKIIDRREGVDPPYARFASYPIFPIRGAEVRSQAPLEPTPLPNNRLFPLQPCPRVHSKRPPPPTLTALHHAARSLEMSPHIVHCITHPTHPTPPVPQLSHIIIMLVY
jgi:hypothetical protein